MEFSIIVIPFLTYLILTFFKKYIGFDGSKIIIIIGQLILLVLSEMLVMMQLMNPQILICDVFNLIKIDYFKVDLSFTFDSVTSIVTCVINMIASLVIYYSFEYMKDDPRVIQFLAHLNLFVGCMLVLVTASNLIVLFIGWEGVGLCSYLLINYWYQRLQANKAAIKAMVMNRIGDCFLILAFISSWKLWGTFDLYTIFVLVPGTVKCTFNIIFFEVNAVTAIGFFLFIAAVGKSAQIGLHTWLPDAMEGPTPVSALLHAATMVTAGVILLVRFSPVLEFASPTLHSLMICIGSLTSLFGASTALFQYDLKRIIAFSTCSQLGLMIVAIGLSNYQLALFHFSNHAFFKALLFLSAGVIIHGFFGEQDIRRMGALKKLFPLCYTTFFIGNLSLAGFPFTSGYYSKDSIFENLLVSPLQGAFFSYINIALASVFTAAYSVRLMYFVFFGEAHGRRQNYEKAHENPSVFFQVPLTILTIYSIFIGYLTKEIFIGLGSSFFASSILNLHSYAIEAEFIDPLFKLIPLMCGIFGSVTTLIYLKVYRKRFHQYLVTKFIDSDVDINSWIWELEVIKFFNKRWYFDIVYVEYIVRPLLLISERVSKNILDRGYFSLIGPVGLSRFIDYLSNHINKINNGILF